MKNITLTPFLTMNGKSKEAMEFYTQVLPDCKIIQADPYGKNGPMVQTEEDAKRILHGAIEFCGNRIVFLDMTEAHPVPTSDNWTKSLMIEVETEDQFDSIFEGLRQGGTVVMGPESVDGIRKCAWVIDKFGIVWQPVWA